MAPRAFVPCLNFARLYDRVAANQTAPLAWHYGLEDLNLRYEQDATTPYSGSLEDSVRKTFLLAPRLLNLFERAAFRLRNHLPHENAAKSGKRGIDRKCSPKVQDLQQAEKCKRDQQRARPES